MCTVVVASDPFLVVANRDEMLDRPARPPFVWPEGFLAPRDELAGGTWLGVNRHGLFVGITNRHRAMRDTNRRTRGEIVVSALAEKSARDVHAKMRELDPRAYNGFHLVYMDRNDILATFADGESLAQVVLGKGMHAITERSFGAGDDSKRLARIQWPPNDPTKLLAEHDPSDPMGSTCIHLPGLNYGTRSAMVWDGTTMLWAEGPPCTTPFARIEEIAK